MGKKHSVTHVSSSKHTTVVSCWLQKNNLETEGFLATLPVPPTPVPRNAGKIAALQNLVETNDYLACKSDFLFVWMLYFVGGHGDLVCYCDITVW